MTARLVVSVHDVAPATFEAVSRWTELLEVRGIPATLLVIPGPYQGHTLAGDARCAAWLRERASNGDEIALHGWEHRQAEHHRSWCRATSGRLIARGCAEFWDLSPTEVARRLTQGRGVLAGSGVEAEGVTPPGWLVSRSAIGVIAMMGFRYVATQWRVLDLREARVVRLPAVSHRPGSPLEGLAATALDRWARHALERHHSLRVALHPRDVATTRLRETTLRVLDAFLAAGVRPVTYRQLLDVDSLAVGLGA